jgi:hypothetical protein
MLALFAPPSKGRRIFSQWTTNEHRMDLHESRVYEIIVQGQFLILDGGMNVHEHSVLKLLV